MSSASTSSPDRSGQGHEATGRLFLRESAHLLADSYLPRIRACVERLTEEDLQWRPHATSNSVVNLLLHLAGNLRQWVVAGAGGASDTRDRSTEFTTDPELSGEEALARLEATVADAVATLHSLEPGALTESRTIQGIETTVLGAVYHAVEHVSMHAGQIVYVAKLRTGEHAGFYRIEDGHAEPAWWRWGSDHGDPRASETGGPSR